MAEIAAPAATVPAIRGRFPGHPSRCETPTSLRHLVSALLQRAHSHSRINLPIPHRVAQVLTQGSLPVALVLALSINPRLRIRPNWFLGLYTLLATTSLMMSVRLIGLGTAYRSFGSLPSSPCCGSSPRGGDGETS